MGQNRRSRPSPVFAPGIPSEMAAYVPCESDRQTVFLMAAAGIPRAEIAMCVGKWGIAVPTLEQHFARELISAKHKVTGLAMHAIMQSIKRNEPWAVTLWMKCRGGWSDNPRYQVEVSIGRDRNASLEDVDDMIAQADTEERQAAIAEPGATTIEASAEVPDEQP